MIPATVPEHKRGVLEGDSELDRTVILSNVLLTCGGYIDGLL